MNTIIDTICYADIFSYPLTLEEVERWLFYIQENPELKLDIKKALKNSEIIEHKNKYYYLKGRSNIVSLRIRRELFSKDKFKIAQKAAQLLKNIPSIRLIGLTGSIAMYNANQDDDIDLFIITSANLLWTTRFFATLLLEITNMRRHPDELNFNNKICLNMFIEEDNLTISKNEQDIFSAHEVLQMKPLYIKDDIYQRFLKSNDWVKKYLPSAFYQSNNYQKFSITNDAKKHFTSSSNVYLIETILRKFQLWYMRNRRTTEVIKNSYLRFHPHDARSWILKRYKEIQLSTKIKSKTPKTSII